MMKVRNTFLLIAKMEWVELMYTTKTIIFYIQVFNREYEKII